MADLWPNDLGLVDIKSPLSILKDQAAMLGQKTQMIVKAEVGRGNLEYYYRTAAINKEDLKKFLYEFYIVAPVLENYRYRLFSIIHDVDLYPVEFLLDVEIEEEIIGEEVDLRFALSESQFIDMLGHILNSNKTKKVIRSLLAQSREFP
jgi:hypothetical protein